MGTYFRFILFFFFFSLVLTAAFLAASMHPILEKTLFRMLMFHAYGLFVAWIFTFIEKRAESSHERMERILQELKNEVDTNYNMTNNDFARFVAKAAEAVMEGNQLDWNFLNSCGFVFAALTTIGKKKNRNSNYNGIMER